ncbi:hypothetical protein EsDP_00007346 [Epichloe bromicola]|uniref:DNA replication regulator SLD2 n=1 Tax=Epichloe bromicola TaxID=79588 RepID=A0ABQ0D0B0_9HYPO
MDDETKAAYEEKSKDLRAELKRWENEWGQTHDGKKPGRQDIKDNADIARKYKDYHKYRDILSGKLPPPSKPESNPKRRRCDPVPAETPLKRTKHADTPSKQRPHDGFMNTPAISRRLFSPAPVTSLGPTPQRDGHVLGLFDLLVEKELGTPSRKDKLQPHGTPSRAGANVLSTPSKRTAMNDPGSTTKLGRTPMSSSRKQMLNMFATPMKNRRGSIDGKTMSSVSKLQFDTPVFLKRHGLPAVDENAMFADPAPLRLPRKPLVRGLSEIVASLRKVEEDVLDDDLEALREIENDTAGVSRPMSPSLGTRPAPAPVPAAPAVLEPDSQGRPMLLGGFDNEEMYDSAHEDGVDRNGNPLPAYKKKGQKRTTRKANIRPTMKKRPQVVVAQEHGNGEDDEGADVVPETQVIAGPDGDYEDGASSDEAPAKGAANKKSKAKKDVPVKKVAKKVNELAHANFKRLKLRNHGAKGGPGFNSRFRRRR